MIFSDNAQFTQYAIKNQVVNETIFLLASMTNQWASCQNLAANG